MCAECPEFDDPIKKEVSWESGGEGADYSSWRRTCSAWLRALAISAWPLLRSDRVQLQVAWHCQCRSTPARLAP